MESVSSSPGLLLDAWTPSFPASTAFHYTGATGLLGMLQSHQIWAGSPAALNDTAEVAYGRRRVWNRWHEIKEHHSDADRSHVETALHGYLAQFGDGGVYMFSASQTADLANQWLNYTTGDSYCVSFDMSQLLVAEPTGNLSERRTPMDRLAPAIPGWFEVHYGREKQNELIDELIALIVASEGGLSFITEMRQLYTLVCTLKDERFAAENEVRYLWSRGSDEIERFRVSGGKIVAYAALTAGAVRRAPSGSGVFSSTGGRLPITSVMVGPRASPSAIVVTRRALDTYGYGDVELTQSDIALRG
ncbi:hypothetical protein DEI93_15990 [Curtobacterium sp. MCBD17_035]|uniref:hypothetical protein n=1 Tax=Curtobacterium sp. MCBD17_035 TaxID=2175673 RepID=UPI000DA8AB30|nr:hypothetical protein [Curtobacterium sp. MCBD17_035]WIB67430.1 hypothetical protein DEI93_15990 [Curtobacterium sp. MCBD17_035]